MKEFFMARVNSTFMKVSVCIRYASTEDAEKDEKDIIC